MQVKCAITPLWVVTSTSYSGATMRITSQRVRHKMVDMCQRLSPSNLATNSAFYGLICQKRKRL